MLIRTTQPAVLRTLLVAIIVPVVALAPLPVTHIIIAVTHIVIPEARVVQVDCSLVDIDNIRTLALLGIRSKDKILRVMRREVPFDSHHRRHAYIFLMIFKGFHSKSCWLVYQCCVFEDSQFKAPK